MATPIDAVTASLANAFEVAPSPRAAQKVFQIHLKQLAPLRATANPGEIENFYIVAAWFSPYRFTPIVLAQHYGVPDDNAIVGSSRAITAITNLNRSWGAGAVEKLREALQLDVPLPNWPKRDFLETLNKIANTGYKLDSLTQHLPRFLSIKLRTATVPDRPYFRQGGQRRVIRSDLDDFYRSIVEPAVIDSLSGQRKRRKTSISGRRTRANARDDQVELPRRLDNPQFPADETIDPAFSPAPARNSLLPQPECTGPLSRLSCASQEEGSLHEQELQVHEDAEETTNNEEAITLPQVDDHEINEINDQEAITLPRLDEHDISEFSNAEMLRRTHKPPTAATEAKIDVQNRFNDFHHFTSGMNPAVQWLIDSSVQRVELKAKIETAGEALGAVECKITNLEAVISSMVPLGMSLTEAIDAAQLDLENLETLYDEALAQQRAIEAFTNKLSTAGLHFLAAHIQIDERAAMAERTRKELKLKELEDLDTSLTSTMEEQTEKKEAIRQLEVEYEQAKKDMGYTRAIFDLVQNPLTYEALAALKTLTSVEEFGRRE